MNSTPPFLLVLLATIALVVVHAADDSKQQTLNHKNKEAVHGTKHIDAHDAEQLKDRDGNTLDHKGKDKSKTVTNAQLTANLQAKDHHEDSYSHMHDNAHETDAEAEHDHLQGDEAMMGVARGANSDSDLDSLHSLHHAHHDHHDDFGSFYSGHDDDYFPVFGDDRHDGHDIGMLHGMGHHGGRHVHRPHGHGDEEMHQNAADSYRQFHDVQDHHMPWIAAGQHQH